MRLSVRKNILWNTSGSIFYLGCQWLTTVLIVRLCHNYEEAGIYSLAMSISNIFYIIATYNIRNYQVSDINEVFGNNDYFYHRICTTIISFAILISFISLEYNDTKTKIILIGYLFFRSTETSTDYFHGIDQKHDRMDIVGISYFIRGITLLSSFAIMEYLFDNLGLTIIVSTVMVYSEVVIWDYRKSNFISKIINKIDYQKVKKLFVLSLPLLIYGISLNILSAIPRINCEKILGSKMLGYYSSIATPAVIIQSIATVIFLPLNGMFTEAYNKKESRLFWKLFWGVLLGCFALGGAAVLTMSFMGEFIIKILYNDLEIVKYSYLLKSTVVCTAMVAIIWFLEMIITIIRELRTLAIISILGMVVEVAISQYYLNAFMLNGLNWSLMIGYSVLIILMIVDIIYVSNKNFKKTVIQG